MLPILYFIRHGETDWNVEGRLQGQRDIPLNERGRAQSIEVGLKLRDVGAPAETLPWLVSPLQRTQETARLARHAIGLSPHGYRLEDGLKELTFGEWEGSTWSELRGRNPMGVERRFADKWNFAPPSGESYAMLSERAERWLDSIKGDAVIVSHGGVARVLLALRGKIDPREAASMDIWQGRLLIFQGGEANWV